jgi:hypothetical protein
MLALLSPTAAHAWDGVESGKIYSIDVVADGENRGFRVYLESGSVMCTGSTETWGYINRSFSNYEAMVSILTSAYLSEQSVTLYTNLDSYGYCAIGYIAVHK